MVNAPKIQSSLTGLTGFRQPFNPNYAILDAANLTSRSGQYYTDNEFVKVEFIKDGQDFKDISDANFNTYLQQKQDESIFSVCNSVFNKVDFIDRGLLYNYALNKVNTITLPVGFVGYKIQVSTDNNIAISIKRVLLDFSGVGSIELLLYNTSKIDPIQSKVISITTDHQEEVLDWVVDNTDGLYKGDYYIGYLTTGVVPKPYARDYERSDIKRTFTHLNIEQMQVPGHAANTLFDLTTDESMTDANGLNLDLIVYDDYTDLIINNEQLFATAIKLDMQINLISIGMASIRSNRNERMSDAIQSKMLVELEGADNGVVKQVGLRTKLNRSIGLIKSEIKKLQEGYFGGVLFTGTIE